MADGTIIIDTDLDSSGVRDGLKKIEGIAKTGFTGITTAITAIGTAGIGAGAAIVKVGSEFESQMSRVKAISGATTDEFKQLQDQAIKLGADTSFSSREAAEGMENLASAGFTTKEIMSAMPGLLDLAASSGESLASSSDIAASTLRGFGLEASQAGHVADVLAKNAGATNAAVADTGEAMKYIAPISHAMGISLEETTAAIGELSNAGIKGSQAGTTLRSALTRLASPSDNAAAKMEELGFNAFDSQGKLKKLSTIMDEYNKALEGKTDQQKQDYTATIFGMEAMSGMLVLAGQGGKALNDLSESYKNADGAAAEMAKTMKDNLKGALDQLQGSLESFGLQIYYSVNNPLKDVVNNVNDMVGQLSEAFKSGGFNAVAEKLGDIFATIATSIAKQLPSIINMSVKVIQNFITGIKNNISQLSQSGVDIVTSLVEGIIEILPQLLDLGVQLLGNIAKGIGDNLPTLIPKALECVETIVNGLLDNIDLVIDGGLKLILGLTDGIINAIPKLIEKIPQIIVKIVDALIKNDVKLIEAGIKINLAIAEGIIKSIPQLVAVVPKLIFGLTDAIRKGNFSQVGNEIVKSIAAAPMQDGANFAAWAKKEVESIKNTFKTGGLKETIKQVIEEATPGMNESASNFVEWAKNTIRDAKEAFQNGGLKEVFKTVIADLTPTLNSEVIDFVGWIRPKIEEFKQYIEGAIQNIVKAIMDPFGLLPDGVQPHFSNLLNNLNAVGLEMIGKGDENSKATVDAIVNAFESLPGKMLEIGGHVINGLIDGIKSKKKELDNAIVNTANKVIEGFKSIKSFDIHSPSRIMRDQVGIFVTQGLTQGILLGVPELLNTTKNIANDVISSIQKPILNADLAGSMVAKFQAVSGNFQTLANEIKKSKQDLETANSMKIDGNQNYLNAKAELDRINDLEAGNKKAISSEEKKRLKKDAEYALETAKQAAELEILVAKNTAETEVKTAEDKQKRITKLAEATTTAIKNQLEEQKKASQDAYTKELKDLEDLNTKQLASIDKTTKSKTDAIDKQLKALEIANTDTTREEEKQAAKQNINMLKTKMANTASQADKDSLALQIKNAQKELSKKEDTWNIEDEKAKLEERKTVLAEQAEIKKANLQKEYEDKKASIEKEQTATNEYYDKLLQTDALNAAARYTILTNNNDELVKLLNSYAPNWQDAGQTLADGLINGLNSKQTSVNEAISELINIRGNTASSNSAYYDEKGNLLKGYKSGTSYNSLEGLYEVDEEGFETTNNGSVAYVSKGASINNNMQSLKAIKEQVLSMGSDLYQKLQGALYAEQYQFAKLAYAGATSNSNINNYSDGGLHLNIENLNLETGQDVEQFSDEMNTLRLKKKKF